MSNRGPGFILIFILAVATALLAIAWVFPEDGLSIDYSYQIKYPTMERLLGSEEPEYKNISETIMLADSIADAIH